MTENPRSTHINKTLFAVTTATLTTRLQKERITRCLDARHAANSAGTTAPGRARVYAVLRACAQTNFNKLLKNGNDQPIQPSETPFGGKPTVALCTAPYPYILRHDVAAVDNGKLDMALLCPPVCRFTAARNAIV